MEHNIAVLLIGGAKIGGAEKRFGRMYESLSEKDESVILIINEVLYKSLLRHGIRLDRAKNVNIIYGAQLSNLSFLSRMAGVLSIFMAARRIIRAKKVTVLHSMGYLLLLNFLLFLTNRNVIHGISIFDASVDSEINTPVLRFLFKQVLRRSDFIDFLSNDIKNSFIMKYGDIAKGVLHVSPCSFIDYSLCDLNGVVKEPSVVFMARLVNDKNPFLFIDSVRYVLDNVKEQDPRLRFYIIGTGPLEDELKGVVKEAGLKKVIFSYAYEFPDVLKRSRIFVSLQKINNYPSQSLIEAMACENAVIATDVGETGKLVNAETGLLIHGNVKELGDAICELINHPERAGQMGKNGRRKVMTEHTVERFISYLIGEVYSPYS